MQRDDLGGFGIGQALLQRPLLRSGLLQRGDYLRDIAGTGGDRIDQVRAVRIVEAAGIGFDRAGMPKILYERHKFHRQTDGRFSPAPFSQSSAGGYTDDANRNGIKGSWDRLCEAIATGQVDAAFQSCSLGLFQVMGEWWDVLEYPSPYAMA